MSKLIILEGISGTGKSSLPQAIAKVINTNCEKIEVQAGWRDRYDLLGYYNSFEKKYYESQFLISLYKAQIGENNNRPNFILLDEMNLSHTEYYFADFLSELERSEIEDRKIKLLPKVHNIKQPPKQFVQNNEGLYIKIPQNTWFVGTANNDETTMGFADKTYDRAFVMELPDNKPEIAFKEVYDTFDNIYFKDLMQIFEQSKEKHKDKTKKVQNIFKKEILPKFKDVFNISWGNRLDNGIENFTAANIELGGSIDEAIDYILAFKVLHKIKDRKDLEKINIEIFEDDFEKIKIKNDIRRKMVKTENYFKVIKDNGIAN